MPKIKSEFSDFTVAGSWAYYDCLDGFKIEKGDTIVLKWPDGTEKRIRPDVRESKQTVSDMGHPYDCPVSTAYFKIDHNGAEIELRMVNCKGLKGRFATNVSSRQRHSI